ncbi:MAG: helix-turn-helix transcriptional regulator [Rhodoblastus sp.]
MHVALTPSGSGVAMFATMTVARVYGQRQPRRPHFIAAWAETRGLKQADLARELDADKGLVSRWFGGSTPGPDWQEKLAAFFDIEPDALFRHPDDDWLARFLRNRPREEIDRIKNTLEAAFPRRKAS